MAPPRTERPSDSLDLKSTLAVLTAVKNGDFSARMPVEYTGLAGKLADTMNAILDRNEKLVEDMENVSRAVGREGKFTARVQKTDYRGGWAKASEAVNTLIDDLVQPTAEISRVIGAVAKGDLTKKMPAEIEGRPIKGEFLRTTNTINTMIDQLSSFSSEVTRVAQEVGTMGILGGQAVVKGVSGTWKELTDNVNTMATNLTEQVRSIADVTVAVANGDLTKKITIDARGEVLELRNTINTMVDQLNMFAGEVTRVAQEVGTEGKLGGQAEVEGVVGTWKELTDNVNTMATNLTEQVRSIADVTTAVALGDLTKKITIDARGEVLELKNTINTMVDQLSTFAGEVTRVAQEVGTEGNLGGQAVVEGVAGTWKELTDNVNTMAANLTEQVRSIAQVTTAVASGDLTKQITIDAKGEVLELKNTINTMVDQLSTFSSEVTRVALEVGTEGNLGGQAVVEGVAGTWKELTDNVNTMAANLTEQVRSIAEVTVAVANGDLTKKITIDARGELMELRNTINTMVDQLNNFAGEVTRVAQEVGTDGKLGGQAEVKGVSGTWKELTDNVNTMAGNLTEQVRSIAEVTVAVANGDLTKKITIDARGELMELRNTINTMVDQLNMFAGEVTRVAQEVGTDGKLGGQAEVKGVSGTWKELTDNVNTMAGNLTEQVRSIAEVTTAVANGNLTKQITIDAKGEVLELKNTINTMVDQLSTFSSEVTRVALEVGTEGNLGEKAVVEGVAGTWKELTDNVNTMAANLTEQVRSIAEVTTAVANGNLTKKITTDAKGEVLELRNTINTMVDQLNTFAGEVTRVAQEVGTDGTLGGQAVVKGVSGTWKELTDNVNTMVANLTTQVRGISEVVTAIANGDLKKKLTLEAKGEILTMVETINGMIETLDTFARQVTDVAREVGTEGKLGGNADVPATAGTWRDLTESVNELADNLTRQVRAIAEVVSSVTKGDLTRTITVEASGEVGELKENINEMISTLKDTTESNQEQDWLKTNLAKFTGMLQGQRDLRAVADLLMSQVTPVLSAQHGVVFLNQPGEEDSVFTLTSSYAYKERKHLSSQFKLGEGLVGQCALEKNRIMVTEVPGDYVKVNSGLGEATPMNIVVVPVLFEDKVRAVVEFASFNQFTDIQLTFLDQLAESLGIVLNTIDAAARTESLLKESQTLTEELQSQQEELKQTNEELEQNSRKLAQQKMEVENKNREVERAKHELEEKAEELSLTSRYKSQFLANMSHELRTPLNSLLILSKLLTDNPDRNLTDKQVEFARNIHTSGNDLLQLINEILDLSKIESGTMKLDVSNVPFPRLRDGVERNFNQVAEEKELDFKIRIDPSLPPAIHTDENRLQQVLKNLLSNAFKFTEKGSVTLEVGIATEGWRTTNRILAGADSVVAFRVKDTGIGIPRGKEKIIFEAFQQAEGGTTRSFGGTGLGLSISREIATLLGGEIRVQSVEGRGSTFTLFLPVSYAGSVSPAPRADRTVGHKSASEKPAPSIVADTQDSDIEKLLKESVVPDDRDTLEENDRVLLIIEDDIPFAEVLCEMAHEKGFKTLVAGRGDVGLALARKHKPDAVTLDIRLPVMDGWQVLDRIKHDPEIRHIPVHVISVEEARPAAIQMGAFACLKKPVDKDALSQALGNITGFIDRKMRKLLVVEDDETSRQSIEELVGDQGVETTAVATGKEALQILRDTEIECMILDLMLPDMSGFDLIQKIEQDPELDDLPIIVYTGKDLTPEEETRLQHAAQTVIVKGAQSPERLLDEVSLFLHRVEAELPEPQRELLQRVHQYDPLLAGKTALIVDDDVRNIFALSSVLESQQMKVIYAETGQEGLQKLKANPGVNIVLMDVMMPEMDGYEAMQKIRENERFKDLPVIALTAKAMQGDREKTIAAGASDYISKPVDTEQLLSMLRVWLYRSTPAVSKK